MIETPCLLEPALWVTAPALDPGPLLEQVAMLRRETAVRRAENTGLPARNRGLNGYLTRSPVITYIPCNRSPIPVE